MPVLGAGSCALHYGAREAVAKAVAFAPNAELSVETTPSAAIPSMLAARNARFHETRVREPDAKIVSWIVEPRGGDRKGTVVLLHGVRLDKRSLATIGAAISDASYRAVMVDLRGHGDSTGDYLTYGAVEAGDVSSVLDSLPIDSRECVGVYGFSYGAAVAIELAARDARIDAVVAVASFSSLRAVTLDYERKYLPAPLRLIPDSWFQGAVDEAGRLASFDPDAAAPVRVIDQTRARVLLLHGAADTQVPLRHSETLAAAAGGQAKLVVIPNGTHESLASDVTGAVRRESLEWFDRWLTPSACER